MLPHIFRHQKNHLVCAVLLSLVVVGVGQTSQVSQTAASSGPELPDAGGTSQETSTTAPVETSQAENTSATEAPSPGAGAPVPAPHTSPAAAGANVPLCDLSLQPELAIGDPISLCVFVSTVPVKKMIFRTKVEESSSLVLRGSENLVLGQPGNQTAPAYPVHTWVAASHGMERLPAEPLNCQSDSDMTVRGHLVSCPQIYVRQMQVVQFLNLVVNMRDGRIHSFAWDNSCAACGPARCLMSSKLLNTSTGATSDQHFESGACGLEYSHCAPNTVNCDLKIFISWAGTDANGKNLRSAGVRLSKFTGMTLRSVYESVDSQLN